jgi:Glutaredoxin-like domain (DUF836)
MNRLIFYSKPGCHLCEGLQEKLAKVPEIAPDLAFEVEMRNIEQNSQWFAQYQYEIPVLCLLVKTLETLDTPDSATQTWVEQPLPRLSPRASLAQLAQMLQTQLSLHESK